MSRSHRWFVGAAALAVSAVLAAPCAPVRAGEAGRKAVRPACVPETAEAWLVLPAPAVSLERVRKLVEAMTPGMGALAELTLKGQMTQQFGEALDTGRPMVAVFAFGARPGYALAVAVKPEADAVKALEARFGRAAGTEGGISTYLQVQEGALPDKEIHVAVKAGRVVLGDSLQTVKLLAAAPAPAADEFAKELDAAAGVDLVTVSARHREKIDEFLKKLETAPADLLPGARGAAPMNLKDLGAVYAAMIRSALRESAEAGMELRLGEAEASFSWLLRPAPDGRLAAAAAKLSAARPPAAGFLPGGAFLTLAGDTPREAMNILAELAGETMTAFPAADEQVRKDTEALMTAWKEMLGQIDGKLSEALVRRGGGLCGLIHFEGVKDPAAARAAAARMVRASLSESLMKQWGGGMKVKADFKEGHRQSAGVTVDRLTLEMTMPAGDEGNAAMIAEMQRQVLDRLYGTPLVCEMAATDKGLFMSFGKEAPAALDELLERAAKGGTGTEMLAATRAGAPQGCFVLGELSLLEYARMAMAMFAGMAPMPAFDLGQDPGKPATFWCQAAPDGLLTMRFNLPAEPVRKLYDAFRKAQQDMMQGRPAVPPVPAPGGPGVEEF